MYCQKGFKRFLSHLGKSKQVLWSMAVVLVLPPYVPDLYNRQVFSLHYGSTTHFQQPKSFFYVHIPDISLLTPAIIPFRHDVFTVFDLGIIKQYVFQSAPPSEWIFQFCSNLIPAFDSESIPHWVHDILLCVSAFPRFRSRRYLNFEIIKRINHF